MLCKVCGSLMFINEWSGWIWECCSCEHEGRRATAEEIEENEQELQRMRDIASDFENVAIDDLQKVFP